MQTTTAALAVVEGPPAKLPPSSPPSTASMAAALKTSASMRKIVDCDGVSSARSFASSDLDLDAAGHKLKSRIFPSTRFFMALLLCLCFVSLAISTSNISVSLVCMVRRPADVANPMDANSTQRDRLAAITQRLVRRLRRAAAAAPTAAAASTSTTAAAAAFDDADDALRAALFDDVERPHLEHAAAAATSSAAANESAGQNAQRSRCALARFRKRAVELSRRFGEASIGDDEAELERLSSVTSERCDALHHFDWTSTQTGIILAAQNAGSLLMLITGTQADRLNSKWMIVVSMTLVVVSNVAVPLVSHISVWLTVAARLLTGIADALLQPSTSAILTRWFPPSERAAAIGVVTGGRQLGTLMIMPLAGYLCSRRELLGGWPAIFYLSAAIGSVIAVLWLLAAADKPSKHACISACERHYIEKRIEEENLGKRKQRKSAPWTHIRSSIPLYAGVAALVCHEYPLVIMLQLLPRYLDQVLHLSTIQNGLVSALPIAVLFISKTLSSSLSSCISARKSRGRILIGRTPLVKIFNGVASAGLAICTAIIPFFNQHDQLVLAIVALCMSMAFAGLHTPGVQTALLQLAPAYTGIVTGIAFGVVAVFGIINKIGSTYIVADGTLQEWRIVFLTSAIFAALPVFFFTIWGSADRQPWATIHSQNGSAATIDVSTIGSGGGDNKRRSLRGGNGPPPSAVYAHSIDTDEEAPPPAAKLNNATADTPSTTTTTADNDELPLDDDDVDESVSSALRLRVYLASEDEASINSQQEAFDKQQHQQQRRF